MNIGILGAGNVGKALAQGFCEAGHTVRISSREPQSESLFTFKEEMGHSCTISGFSEAVEFAELIVLAVNWSGVESVIRSIGPERFAGKIVIDLCNAVEFSETPQLALKDTSAGELIQQWLPGSFVVKTLNMIGSARMVKPAFEQGVPTMFLCGDHAPAKQTVTALLDQIGWKDSVDLGDISRSRLMESLMLTCLIAEIKQQTFGAAFSLLRK